MAELDLPAVAGDFYRRAFAADPNLAELFRAEPGRQQARFAKELATIVESIRRLDDFVARAEALGVRHKGYGVKPAHYRVMGEALLGALQDALGDDWTPDVAEAWSMAYNLTAETMMLGAAG